MKSVAAYYVLVAMNSQEQDAHRRRAQHAAAAASPRPSLLARVRSALGSARPAGSAAEPA
jgi:hypothetical protein